MVSVDCELLKEALRNFQCRVTSARGRWWTSEALRLRLYHYYGFGGGVDFSSKDLIHALEKIGPTGVNVLGGNDTGYHVRRKKFRFDGRRQNLHFVYMTGRTQNPASEPGNRRVDWDPSMTASDDETRYLKGIPSFLNRMASHYDTTDWLVADLRRDSLPPTPRNTSYYAEPSLYWERERTRGIFKPLNDNESTVECLTRRIQMLREAIHDDKFDEICAGGKKAMDKMTYKAKSKLELSMYLLARAYENALNFQGDGYGWTVICQRTIAEFISLGKDTYKSFHHIMDFNAKFRSNEKLQVHYHKRKDHGPKLFRVIPEAKRMFNQFCRDNLETINEQNLKAHIEHDILPVCLDVFKRRFARK